MKKLYLFIFLISIPSFFILKSTFAAYYAPGAYTQNVYSNSSHSNCAYVKVGDPKGQPDLSKCIQETTGSSLGAKVVELAKSQKNKPYIWGGCHDNLSKVPPPNGCSSYDCSGLVRWSWYWATDGKVNSFSTTVGTWGGRNSTGNGTFDETKFQKFYPNQLAQIQPGDAVYFGESSFGPYHTGIYAGQGDCGNNDCFIHAPSTGDVVKETSLSKRSDFIGFLRPIIK